MQGTQPNFATATNYKQEGGNGVQTEQKVDNILIDKDLED